jgi:tRNA-uridine 2-sulfurtransferase
MSTKKKQGNRQARRVLIALSGGIDSAVSAYLLQKQGYEVEAAFMKNWSSTAGLKYDECPWLTDRQDALRVAAFLRIPLHTLDFEKQYKKTVLDYFFNEYKAGRTPNPDVMCNKEIKFKWLYEWAMKHGFDCLATGHYAQILGPVDNFAPQKMKNEKIKNKGRGGALSQKSITPEAATRYFLLRSSDEFKDQTYFIYNIKTAQLPHVLFPIGHLKKSRVRALAKSIGLPNAGKKESMGLCFVGRIRLKDFLEQKLRRKPGPIIDQHGKEIGEHEGLHYYTIGQRQGIRIGAQGPYYVTRKDLATNTLYVTNNPKDKSLEVKEIEIHSVNWISPVSDFPLSATGRFRHQGELEKLKVEKIKKDHYRVIFARPQKAVASGQSLVLYEGKVCLGGGVIV